MTEVTPRPYGKRPLDEPLMRSPKTHRPGPECSPRASCCAQQRTKRSAPFDDTTWRSPSKLHKAGSLEQVRPAQQTPMPLMPPPGLANDGGDMDVDEEQAPVNSTSTCAGEQQHQQHQQQQQSAQWGCMFGKLGLTETSSSRTSPLYGMASENKRPAGAARPSTTSAVSPAATGPATTAPAASLLSPPTEAAAPASQGGSSGAQPTCSNEAKRHHQYGFSQQCTLFFLRNQLN
ncbi:hypothetical protein DUNSADRAFT_2324 [Dunaliella salina]|uniref:Encoded protein n=1 Tax=Dunaliella salina TaxID=3046 RepID=A0ABQ7GVQ9_DUNSA|nr:hypothetical protein DUNSADRAFT_2324 [Dunaliella salina]|eukprot:KAF5838699.1 hypothetical protein DUNSADRAFT_2324 [Dunaliella salina]